MGYKPENTIHDLRSELHTQLQNLSSVRAHRIAEHVMMAALMLPLVAIAAFVTLERRETLPYPHETYRAAAPEGYMEDEKDIDDTTVMEFICGEFCMQSDNLFSEFCLEACLYEEEGSGEEMELEQPKEPVEVHVKKKQIKTKRAVKVKDINIDVQPGPVTSEQTSENSLTKFGIQIDQDVPEMRPHNQVGVYLTSNSMSRESKRSETFEALQNSIGNSFVFDVKGSYVYFESSAPLASEMKLVRPMYDLPAIIQEAKDNGLYTIGRFIVAKDPSMASRKPETQIQNIFTGKGIGDKWVNPGHEKVLEYNEQVLRDLIASGVDEVNFDYIRYPTEYSQKAINLTGEQKADNIELFLQMARAAVEEMGSNTKLGISTYAILGWNFPINFEPLGQDIARFAPLVDVISPMAYPSTFSVGGYYNSSRHPGSRMYYLVYRTLEGYKELLGEDSWKLRPWIQGYYVNSQNLQDQANAVYDAGLCGYTVWSAQNLYGEFFKALENLEVPENCM